MHPTPSPRRRGSSLLEVLIATAILAVLMTSLLEALNGMRQYASFADVQDDLLLESQKVINKINSDLSQSGWYFPEGVNITNANDRSARYYPYIQMQNPSGSLSPDPRGTKFPAHWRTAAQAVLTTPVGLPGAPADFNSSMLTPGQFRTSFYAPSQEIIFLRVNARQWAASPSASTPQTLSFAGDYGGYPDTQTGNQDLLGIKKMSDFSRGPNWDAAKRNYYTDVPAAPGGRIYDIVPGCLWLRTPTGLNPMAVPLLWETVDDPQGATGIQITPEVAPTPGNPGTPAELAVDRLREYTYAVVPNPVGGRGQLVRAFRKPLAGSDSVVAGDRIISQDANYAIVVDEVISERVDRITFETSRNDWDSNLELNQVRVRVFLSRLPDTAGSVYQTRVIEAIVATRVTTDKEFLNSVGTAGTTQYLLQH